MSESHFIDTNLVIGYTVKWDRHHKTIEKYTTACKHTSVYATERVLAEAEKVVNTRRRLASQAARRVFQDFSGNSPIATSDIVNFTRKELSSQPDSAVDHVIQYIKNEQTLYKSLVGTSSQNALRLTVNDIKSDFGAAIGVIEDLRLATDPDFDLDLFTGHLQDYSGVYSFCNRLKNILSGSTVDRDILLDAHHLTQTTGPSSLHFVTMDFHHIHANSSDIEALLSKVTIKKPSDY